MSQTWAISYLEEQLKTTEELLASAVQNEKERAA
jgi:hypothetical protein